MSESSVFKDPENIKTEQEAENTSQNPQDELVLESDGDDVRMGPLSQKPLQSDVRAERLSELRGKFGTMRGLKISDTEGSAEMQASRPASYVQDVPDDGSFVAANESSFGDANFDAELLSEKISHIADLVKTDENSKNIYTVGAIVTGLWFLFSVFYAFSASAAISFAPHVLGSYIAGVFAPPALFWLIVSSLNRRAEIQLYSEALREELKSLLFPTEESARVVHQDIERLCRQAAEMSAASKMVLKSLHRARQGLREEVRDFSGLSKKAETHIDRLSGSLQERIAALVHVIEDIEARTLEAENKAKNGAQVWDEVAQTMMGRTNDMEALGQGADKILRAAETAQAKTAHIRSDLQSSYESLSQSVEEATGKLEGLSGRFDEHLSGLSSAAQHITDETDRLGDMVQGQVASLEGITDKTVGAILRSTETIQEHTDALDLGAQTVSDQAARALRIRSAKALINSMV